MRCANTLLKALEQHVYLQRDLTDKQGIDTVVRRVFFQRPIPTGTWVAKDVNQPVRDISNPVVADAGFGIELAFLAQVVSKAAIRHLNQQENLIRLWTATSVGFRLRPDDIRLGLGV